MERCQVELTLTLYHIVLSWKKVDQIFFSAFQDSMREFSAETVFASLNSAINGVTIDSADTVEEVSFWMELPTQSFRFVLRQPNEDFLLLGDR